MNIHYFILIIVTFYLFIHSVQYSLVGSVYDGFSWQHCRLATRHPAVPDPAITTPFCQFRHLKRPILEL